MLKSYWGRMIGPILALAMQIGGMPMSSATAASAIMTDAQSPPIIHRVENIAALRSLVGSPSIKAVQVMSYHTANDGGGGPVRHWNAASTCTDNGGTCIDPAAPGAGRWVFSANVANVREFGAIGDGSDCTAILQLLLNTFDTIYLPTGDYSINATLTRTTGNLILYGDGMNRSRINRSTNFGDSLLVAAVDPTATRLPNLTLRDLTFRSTTLMTSGAHLHVKDFIHADIRNIHFWNGFISMHFEGLQQAVVANTRIDSGAYYSTGIQAGSKFVLIQDSTNPANETGEVFFSDFNWTHTGYASVEIGLEIQAADGLWFSNGHILGAATECKITPQTATTPLAGVLFSQVWFDGFSNINLKFTGNSAVYKNFRFTGCRFSGARTRAIESSQECLKLQNIQFIGCDIGENQGEGARFNSGDKIVFSGCHTFDTGLADRATTKAIVIGLGVGQISYTGGTIGTTPGTPLLMGLDIQDAAADVNVSGVSFINCTKEISLNGNLPFGSKINNATTDRAAVYNVVAASSITLPTVEDNIELTGASANIATIKWGWHGRTITLLAADAQQTLKHGTGTAGNIINTSSVVDLILSQGQAVRLTFNVNKGGWYQSK